ncbi:MAG TPA: hypothetical protein PLZ08_10315 [Bacillota bacterium]|nr:hypothetical protein [Bacillota bacterium]HOL10062.1 hypothetical protein [Bacillota bacterium]HPO98332.1 hypothetical protein [Bacillota bacterium]
MYCNQKIIQDNKMKHEIAVTLERATRRGVLELPLPKCRKEYKRSNLIMILIGAYLAVLSAAVTLTFCKKISMVSLGIIFWITGSFLKTVYGLWRKKDGC